MTNGSDSGGIWARLVPLFLSFFPMNAEGYGSRISRNEAPLTFWFLHGGESNPEKHHYEPKFHDVIEVAGNKVETGK